MGSNPQESLENPRNIMDTLLGVHPIVPWVLGVWLLAEGISPPPPRPQSGRMWMADGYVKEWKGCQEIAAKSKQRLEP